MVGSGPNCEEFVGSQRQDQFLNLERRRDREVSIHTTHTNRSQSKSGSHVSHRENNKNMQLEINHLRRKLRCKQCKQTPSSLEPSSDDDNDESYRPKSMTPPSESYSCDEDHHYRRRSKSPSHRGLGNDTMSRALCQISKSLFTCRIKGGKLPP